MSDDRGLIGRFYPSVEDVLEIHDTIVESDPDAEAGVQNRGVIEYALEHIEHGSYGEGPETIHEEAYQLMRLLAANHPFVDGNKRTALASTVMFYAWNGYALEYQEELEAMLILISIREDIIDAGVAVEYLRDQVVSDVELFLHLAVDDESLIEHYDFDEYG